MTAIATACLSCLSTVDRWCHITACLAPIRGRSRDGIYEATLADNEREAVSDLLGYLENVCCPARLITVLTRQRTETDFFSGEPLRALSTLVYSDNVDLQRSASLTFAEITERGEYTPIHQARYLMVRCPRGRPGYPRTNPLPPPKP